MRFALRTHHNWSIGEVEEMVVFERDIEIDMLVQFMEFKRQQAKEQ